MSACTTHDRGHVRIIAIDRPERRNALDLADRVELLDAVRGATAEARALVLTGTPEVFCAGGDLASMSAAPEVARVRLDVVNALVRLLAAGSLPVVAAVQGAAYGLGLGLAGACDIIVADSSATFSTAFGRVGLGPDSGVSATLASRVGRSRARELLLTSRVVGAQEALRLGLIDELCEDGTALERAVATADRLGALSAPMLHGVKKLLGGAGQLEEMLEAEALLQTHLLTTPEFEEGRDAFFAQRRPDFINARGANL